MQLCFLIKNYRLHVLYKRITYTLHFVPCHLVLTTCLVCDDTVPYYVFVRNEDRNLPHQTHFPYI